MGGFLDGIDGDRFYRHLQTGIDYYRRDGHLQMEWTLQRGQTFIDWIDIYRLDRHLQMGQTLQTGQTSYRQNKLLQTDGQDGRNGQHEAGQDTEETRHMLVEMLKIQQNEDF